MNNDEFYSLAFTQDGEKLIAGGANQVVYIWDTTGELAPELLSGHTDTIYTLTISPDNTNLLTGSRDTTIRLWHLNP